MFIVKHPKLRINVYSSADKVDGQGVGSAYEEQVKLIKEGEPDLFDVRVNKWNSRADIQHFHTVDLQFFVKMKSSTCSNIAYCHFLPETMEGSLQLPGPIMKIFDSYLINFYKSADRLVVVNPSFIPKLVKLGIPENQIYYIPNYVSKDKFYRKSKEERIQIRKKYNIDPEAFVVLGAGQVQTRKGVLEFCQVAEKLPEIQFVWAGGFSFGRITDGYEKLKKLEENHPDNVTFLGIVPRDEMVDIYNMCDVLFVPSFNELFPMTILEASNIEVPMVIRDLDLYKDILFDHYLKADDNEGFIHCLRMLKEDPETYEKYRKESKAISDFYSKEHVLKMWKDFYISAYIEKRKQIKNKRKNSKQTEK